MLDKNSIKHIHCIGIGGIGVGGIAEFLLKQGYQVTGSDKNDNKVTKRLAQLGATIYTDHLAKQVDGADVVVYSSAIRADNPEFLAAKQAGMHLLQRAEMLAELMADSRCIAISGTHGKTTTTSLLSAIVVEAGLDPSFMIGGKINDMQGPAQLGAGEFFIAEADESDASFLFFHPEIAVINNIEADHMATYDNDFGQLKKTFVDFSKRIIQSGITILNHDDPVVREIATQIATDTITFGFEGEVDFKAADYQADALKSHFTLLHKGQAVPITVNLPGKHNVSNALAAIAVAKTIGVENAAIQKALAGFSGVGRRFNIVGEMALAKGSATVIDDYGHHPGAVKATLDAAKAAFPGRRVVLAFQPHRYTRTHDLMNEFVQTLSEADHLILLEVFSAGENPIKDATGLALTEKIKVYGKTDPVFVAQLDELPGVLKKELKDGDVIILQGAGDIGTMPGKLIL